MALGRAIAIDLGRRRVRALQAVRGAGGFGGSMKIKRVLIEEIPSDLDADDPSVVGDWLGARLREAGFTARSAHIVLGREDVGLKRLTLPTTESAELPEMTRLALHRELPFDADSAVIDFVPIARTETSTTVLAVAAPGAVVDAAKRIARSAGLKVERITLRSMGAAALLNNNGSLHDGGGGRPSGMVIDVAPDFVEFSVIVEGTVRFSRAADVPHPQDRLAAAEAVVTEARRTWMSYRAAEESIDVPQALIIGDDRVSEYAAEPVSAILKAPVRPLHEHPSIDTAGVAMDGAWPLAGALLESSAGGDLIDFANPHRAPDPRARLRTRRLIAAGLAIVAALGVWTFARLDLQRMQRRAQSLAQQERELLPAFKRFERDVARLEHLRLWDGSGVDWLHHAAYLASIAPPPERVVLDSWNAAAAASVSYDRAKKQWSATREVRIDIDGEARDRATADAFREALTQASIYATLTSGADAKGGKRLPFGFSYRLRTEKAPPEPSDPARVAAGAHSSTQSADRP